MLYRDKARLVRALHAFTWPLTWAVRACGSGRASTAVFEFSAILLSLIPGRLGQGLRASFYSQTLAHCRADVSVGFLSFFSRRQVSVGEEVYIGSMSIVGHADIGDRTVIASRVTISGDDGEPVRIGNNTWVGEGALVAADVADHCIIGAGTVVDRPIPSGSVAVGQGTQTRAGFAESTRTSNARYGFNKAVVRLAHAFTFPLALPAVIAYRVFGSEGWFDFAAKLLSLVPGRPGRYLRASYYVLTLPRCGYDLSMSFASFFSHITAEVGQGVCIGSFAIVGTCSLGDNVMVGSRVSILSGKYQHGGGARGRDFKRNPIRYDRVTIGNGSWLGEGCIVMCDVGRGAIVSAGSVVTKPIPDGVTAIGNPARYVRYDHGREKSAGRKPGVAGVMLLAGALAGAVAPAVDAAEKQVALIGASIGRQWQLDSLAARVGLAGVRFEYVGVPDTFDKSAGVSRIAERAAKPDIVIIKECSTYFPGPVGDYRRSIVSWVEALRREGVRPALATVVPVAPPADWPSRAKAWARALAGREIKSAQIRDYNEWVRAYAKQERLALLDLERAVRIDDEDRRLRPEFAAPDRVHLNAEGYRRLDEAMTEFVAALSPTAAPVQSAGAQRAK